LNYFLFLEVFVLHMFLSLWPGQHVLIVWGSSALDAVRAQSRGQKTLPKPQNKDFYGIVCINHKASTLDLQQLYGGEPLLVINAEKYSYKDMSVMHESNYVKRTVHVSSLFPYWHHSFHVEEEPFGFKNTVDTKRLNRFCMYCLMMQDKKCEKSILCDHYVCHTCKPYNYSICYHAEHKKEYFEEDYDKGFFSSDLLLCDAEGCTHHVNSDVGCPDCQ